MSESDSIGRFGRCEICGEPREAVVTEEDFVIQCTNGHQAQ